MKISRVAVCVSVLVLSSTLVFAQRGRSGGASSNAGSMGSMGSTMSADRGNSNASSDHGMSGSHMPSATDTTSMGKQSPDDILSKNTKLSSNLEKLLPAGTTAQQACSGFKNLGQCVAAIHVANNLNIPFADLKSKVTGGDDLGKSIQALKPGTDSRAEVKKARKQANADMAQSNS